MDDAGVADALYTVLSIGIVLVAATAVAGVVLSTTSRQAGLADVQLAGYGNPGLSGGLYCFYYEADGEHSDFASCDPDDIAFKRLALETTCASVSLNSTSAPPGAPATDGTALWAGYISIPDTGSYTLELKSNSQAWLWIDGDLAASTGGPGQPAAKAATLTMTAGNHPIKVKYFYRDVRTASCSLAWLQDGASATIASFSR